MYVLLTALCANLEVKSKAISRTDSFIYHNTLAIIILPCICNNIKAGNNSDGEISDNLTAFTFPFKTHWSGPWSSYCSNFFKTSNLFEAYILVSIFYLIVFVNFINVSYMQIQYQLMVWYGFIVDICCESYTVINIFHVYAKRERKIHSPN